MDQRRGAAWRQAWGHRLRWLSPLLTALPWGLLAVAAPGPLAWLGALGAAAALGLAWRARHAQRNAFETLADHLHRMGNGDLRLQGAGGQRGTLTPLAEATGALSQRFAGLAADLRSQAARVGMAGERLASANGEIAAQVDHQTEGLRQAAGEVVALSQAVARNAEAAATLDALTHGLRERAEHGGRAMADAVQQMSELESVARRMGEIVGTIDGLAFRTNILALNAAVEAARAGESGRGFAVVAAEVRQLALGSANAAQQVRQLIERARGQAERSSREIRAVDQTLAEVLGGVREVNESLRGIASSSREQSQRLVGVTGQVQALEQTCGANVRMVGASTEAATALVERSRVLAQTVNTLRVDQGTADEARALVDRAHALLDREGMERGIRQLSGPGNAFKDRDLYVFAIDPQGHYRIHSGNDTWVGRRVHEVPGIDGDRFLTDIDAARARGGPGEWIEYDLLNASTGRVQHKCSFVRALDSGPSASQQLMIGCGFYIAGPSAPR